MFIVVFVSIDKLFVSCHSGFTMYDPTTLYITMF